LIARFGQWVHYFADARLASASDGPNLEGRPESNTGSGEIIRRRSKKDFAIALEYFVPHVSLPSV
jgi:hypothetical protein